jgi:RNA polymerase sigma factor (sigma-70 family)
MNATDEAAFAATMTANDNDSVENLYALHEERVARIVYAILRYRCVDPPDHAQDVKHDIWVKFKQGVRRYDSRRGELGPWLITIAKNTSLTHIRRCDTRARPIEDTEVEGLLGEAPAEGAESRIVRRILLGELWAQLDDQERRLAELVFISELSYQEIARRLGINEGAARVRKYRLERKLQELANQTK